MKRPDSPAFIQLSAHFWQLDRAQLFAGQAPRLYYYLLHAFLEADWPATLLLDTRRVAIALDLTERAVRLGRLGLVARGVLRFKGGNHGRPATWELVLPAQPIPRPRDLSKRPAQRVCAPR